MNILLVEDEARIADFVIRGLKGDGFAVSHAVDGESALDILKSNTFDVILLDIMLPGMSGTDVCRRIRMKRNFTPILMLTALDETDDRVEGLAAGADDFLSKPFEFDELIARINALARRSGEYSGGSTDEQVLKCGSLSYDRQSFIVTRDGQTIDLTETERALLALFMMNPERVIARERILNSVWGAHADPLTNVVDVYVGRLRKKLGLTKDSLKNIRGVGYRFTTGELN